MNTFDDIHRTPDCIVVFQAKSTKEAAERQAR